MFRLRNVVLLWVGRKAVNAGLSAWRRRSTKRV